MTGQTCTTCSKPKAPLQCGACTSAICKTCAQFLEDSDINFLGADNVHPVYCNTCYDNEIAPKLAEYRQLLELAKNVNVYEKSQTKESRLLKRTEKPVEIANCSDYQDVLMKLAVKAAQKGFNCLVDVQASSKKIKNGSYTTVTWSGSGIPTQVREHHVIPNRALWQNPN